MVLDACASQRACFERICKSALQSCIRHLAYAAINTPLSSCHAIVFHLVVPSVSSGVTDTARVLLLAPERLDVFFHQ